MAKANPPARHQRKEIARLGPKRNRAATASADQDEDDREPQQRGRGPGVLRDPERLDGLRGEQAAADDRHEGDEDAERREHREQRRAQRLGHEAAVVLDVDRAVHGLHHGPDAAHRGPQREDRADAQEARARVAQDGVQLRPELRRDVRRQVVRQRADDLAARVLEAGELRAEAGERGEEDHEREQGEQEAVGEAGGEVRDLVVHDLGDQPLREVERAGKLHGRYPTPGRPTGMSADGPARSRRRISDRPGDATRYPLPAPEPDPQVEPGRQPGPPPGGRPSTRSIVPRGPLVYPCRRSSPAPAVGPEFRVPARGSGARARARAPPRPPAPRLRRSPRGREPPSKQSSPRCSPDAREGFRRSDALLRSLDRVSGVGLESSASRMSV